LASPPLQNSIADDIVALVVDAAKPQPEDKAIDLACGPGTVACALAKRVRHVVGLDSTVPMLEQARGFARRQSLDNVEWRAGDVYQTPFADGSFDIVTCRFAFHHFEKPALAFAEMVRLVATGGRVVVCDGLASEQPAKAEAFNAMERRRDPSTVEFRTLTYLRRLFEAAGGGDHILVYHRRVVGCLHRSRSVGMVLTRNTDTLPAASRRSFKESTLAPR
jgi:ubiquinone/menaquinone biosynthesis C-methylase UbiE